MLRPRSPTGRGRPLKRVTVWVRIPPGAPCVTWPIWLLSRHYAVCLAILRCPAVSGWHPLSAAICAHACPSFGHHTFPPRAASIRRRAASSWPAMHSTQERGYEFGVFRDLWANEFCVLQVNFPDLLAQRPPWPDQRFTTPSTNDRDRPTLLCPSRAVSGAGRGGRRPDPGPCGGNCAARTCASRGGGIDRYDRRLGARRPAGPSAALSGMRAALRPGGRLGAIVYSTPEANRFFSVPVSIIRRAAQLPLRCRASRVRSASARRTF